MPARLTARGGSITGPIWLCHGPRDEPATSFSELGWTDFPVVILGWWFGALRALEAGEASEAYCRFMDGAFSFVATPSRPTRLRVRCLDEHAEPPALVAEFEVPAAALRASVGAAAEALLVECDRRRWAGRDVETLRLAAIPGRSDARAV